MSFFMLHRNYLVYVFCTRCVVRCFHHDTDHRLGAALSYEDASVIAQGLCYVFYCFLYCRDGLCSCFVCHADIL